MKKNIIIFLTMICFSAYGQRPGEPTYYLNSTEINIKKVYINPTSVDSIYINKQTVNGEVFLFTKNEDISFFSLNGILKEYTDLASLYDSILIKINGGLIKDISAIKIDESFFIYVDITHISDAKYLSEIFRDLKIVNVDLESEKRNPQIMIRGADNL